jgi:hypothetical protein
MEFYATNRVMNWLHVILPLALGALGGYAYYAFIGCVSGSCPITSNPWSSTVYGTLIGALFVRRPMRRHRGSSQSEEQS